MDVDDLRKFLCAAVLSLLASCLDGCMVSSSLGWCVDRMIDD